jgi:hypothetical protein
MTVRDVLVQARQRIATPEHWCRGALSRDREGVDTERYATEPCSWCAEGALYAVIDLDNEAEQEAAHAAFSLLNDALPKGRRVVARFNDNASHAEVLALYDRAIAATEQQPWTTLEPRRERAVSDAMAGPLQPGGRR